MKRVKSSWVIAGMLLLTSGICRNVFADAKQEAQLAKAQTEIDKHAGVWSNDNHISRLSKYFKMPESAIQKLSLQKQGWGAITIELAMAWELNTLHSDKFQTMTDSLNGVEELRAQGKDWGYISKTLEIGLVPVVKEAKSTAKELRQDDLAMERRNQEHAAVVENRRIIKEEHQIAQDNRADRQ